MTRVNRNVEPAENFPNIWNMIEQKRTEPTTDLEMGVTNLREPIDPYGWVTMR